MPPKRKARKKAGKRRESRKSPLNVDSDFIGKDGKASPNIAIAASAACFFFFGLPETGYFLIGKAKKALIYIFAPLLAAMLIIAISLIGLVSMGVSGFFELIGASILVGIAFTALKIAVIIDIYKIVNKKPPLLPDF